MNRKSQQGMNRISRLLPHLGAASDAALPRTDLPLLDGRDLRAMVAHCVNLGALVNFFETAEAPFGTWGDILRLLPEFAAACLLEEAALQEQATGADRPARIAAMVADAQSFEDPKADTLIREELDWQNAWIDQLEKAGLALSLPPFPQWPGEQEAKPKTWHDTDLSPKSCRHDAALRIALRRSLLLEKANALWDNAISRPEGKRAPHAGMLLAFLERYSTLQQGCNSLVPLHTSYFYEKVMGFSPKSAMPDRVLACFCAAPEIPWSTVPTGSLLTVPGQAIHFIAESDTPFSQVSLGEFRAITPATPPGPFASSAVRPEEKENGLWPLFRDVAASASPAVGATLFTLPGMALAGGLRELVFSIALESQSDTAVSALEEAWAAHPTDFAAVTISGDDGWLTPSSLSFSLSFPSDNTVGTDDGGQASLSPDTGDSKNSDPTDSMADLTDKTHRVPALLVSLTLAADQPGILPPQEDIHGLTADHPMMRFVPSAVESPLWQALNAFSIKDLSVEIRVRGFRSCDLTVDGNVIPNPDEGTVAIFGSDPGPASSFVLTVPELSEKRVSGLLLRWQWEAPEQFDSYFAAYPFMPISLIPAMRNGGGIWHEAGSPVVFQGKFPQQLDCPLPESGLVTAWRWHLSTEGSLFGQAIYPRLLAQAALNESALLRRVWARITGGLRLKDVNPPLLPQWAAISVDYEASLRWDANMPGTVIHVHPWPGLYPQHPKPPRLFPHYDNHSLSLGFIPETKTDRGIPLSLYFCLQNLAPDGKGPPMHVHGADVWKDETKGLTRSGIMGMTPHTAWPEESSPIADHDPGPFWLRFDWPEIPHIALQGIHAHAVWATFAPEDENALNARSFPLPPGSLAEVTAPTGEKRGILDFSTLTVNQPYPSVGGRPQGGRNVGAYRQECAEELSHRGQAILPRDFERLILRTFPDVLAALCVPHSKGDLAGNSPGSVAVVIFSPQEGAKRHGEEAQGHGTQADGAQGHDTFTLDPCLPAYADAELFRQIAAYLDSRSSPYATLTLVHPVYRRVDGELRVLCDKMKNLMEAEAEIRHFLAENIAPWAFEPLNTVFGRTLDTAYLRARVEAFSWVLGVDTFEINWQAETSSAFLPIPFGNGDGTIVAGTGALFYPGKLRVTCIRGREDRHV